MKTTSLRVARGTSRTRLRGLVWVLLAGWAGCGGLRADLEDGLLVYYPFSGNAEDAGPNGHDGTVLGARLTEDRNGQADQAYEFNGVSDWINIGQGVKPNFPATVAAWVYQTSTDGGAHTIFRSGSFTTNAFNGIMLSCGTPGYLYTHIGSGPNIQQNYRNWVTQSFGLIPTNTWTHVAVAWLGFDNMRFYVDGTLRPGRYDQPGSGTTIVDSPTDGGIGKRDNPNVPAAWSGKLDEIRVYDRELSADEVRTLAIETPQVTVEPGVVQTNGGSTVVFTAQAVGVLPLAYQWLVDSNTIAGATGPVLTLTDVELGDSGVYRVVVSNWRGTNWAEATLTVGELVGGVRTLPAVFTGGVPFDVALRVVPQSGTFVYGVADTPPAGWTVSAISDGGSIQGGQVQWLFVDGEARTLTYRVLPPQGAVGVGRFVGTVNFNGTDEFAITGRSEVQDESVTVAAGTVSLLGSTFARVTVNGRSGASYHLLVRDGLEAGVAWRTNRTLTLTGASTNWVDTEGMNRPRRFYRVQVAP